MKNIDLGQTIAILANVGVIAGIVFLAVEIRQNNEVLVAQTSYLQFAALRERRITRLEYFDLLFRGRSGAPLTPIERAQVNLLVNDVLDEHRWQFREFQAGRLPDDYLDLRIWRDVWNNTPELIALFEEDRPRLDPEFVRFVEDDVIGH